MQHLTLEDVQKKVFEILADAFVINVDKIHLNQNLHCNLGVDTVNVWWIYEKIDEFLLEYDEELGSSEDVIDSRTTVGSLSKVIFDKIRCHFEPG